MYWYKCGADFIEWYRSFDGFTFDFQNDGEYILARLNKPYRFEVQTRQVGMCCQNGRAGVRKLSVCVWLFFLLFCCFCYQLLALSVCCVCSRILTVSATGRTSLQQRCGSDGERTRGDNARVLVSLKWFLRTVTCPVY